MKRRLKWRRIISKRQLRRWASLRTRHRLPWLRRIRIPTTPIRKVSLHIYVYRNQNTHESHSNEFIIRISHFKFPRSRASDRCGAVSSDVILTNEFQYGEHDAKEMKKNLVSELADLRQHALKCSARVLHKNKRKEWKSRCYSPAVLESVCFVPYPIGFLMQDVGREFYPIYIHIYCSTLYDEKTLEYIIIVTSAYVIQIKINV